MGFRGFYSFRTNPNQNVWRVSQNRPKLVSSVSCSTKQCIRAILTEVVISMWYLSPQIKKKLVWEWGRTSLQVRLGVKRKINDKTMFAFLRRSRKWREAKSPRVDNATITLSLRSLFSTTAKTHSWHNVDSKHFMYIFRTLFDSVTSFTPVSM